MNIFERASRAALRFDSGKGDLTTEQLWQLPLESSKPSIVSLDTIGRAVVSELKTLDEGSLVNTKSNPRKSELELRLEIVKHIIASKQADILRAEKAADTAQYTRRLEAALVAQEDKALANMSPEAIRAELAKVKGGGANG